MALAILWSFAEEERRKKELNVSRRAMRDANNPLTLSDREFVAQFRLSKTAFGELCREVIPLLQAPKRKTKIRDELKVLAALSLYGGGSYQRSVASSFTHNMSQPALSNCLEEVTNALNNEAVLNKYIKFPTSRQRREDIMTELDFKKWAARGQEHKDLLENRKRIIQNKFKDELNLLIDIVKQGSGTTNDGNTARRFFEFPEITAAITGLDEELVRRFAVILQAITSGEVIELMKFKEYARKTAERYVELYDWYHMSSTVHKLLIHGADIIANNNIVPIGKLSEEASEARNKDFRRFREHNSRKMSRQASNADILNMLILSSDPLISSQRPKLETKKGKDFFAETLELIKFPESPFEVVDMSNLEPDSELGSDESDFD